MNKLKWIGFVMIFLIIGCAGIQTGKRMTLFDDTARAYLRAIRWGDYETAFAFRNLQSADTKLPDLTEAEKKSIIGGSIKSSADCRFSVLPDKQRHGEKFNRSPDVGI